MSSPSHPPSPHSDRRSGLGSKGLLDVFLRSPLAGIAPWVLMSVLAGPGRFEEAVCAALGFSLLVLWIGYRRGIAVHLLEVFGVVYFAGLAAVAAVAPPNVIRWMELWAGEITNVALALFAAVTLLIRRPFTLAYARDSTPREFWDSPLFLRVNYHITVAWTAAFFFAAAVGCYGDIVLRDSDNFWTGWILQLAASMFAISFTDFYPDYVQSKALTERGDATAPPQSLARLFDWIPTFVLVTGIVGLVTDSLTQLIGFALIGFGASGAVLTHKLSPRNADSAPIDRAARDT